MPEIFVKGGVALPQGEPLNAAGTTCRDRCISHPGVFPKVPPTPDQKSIPHDKHPSSLCLGVLMREKFHFAHFGGSCTNIPANSHGLERREKTPRSKDRNGVHLGEWEEIPAVSGQKRMV